MMISLTPPNVTASIQYAEVLTLSGRTLFELPLKKTDGNVYVADPFIPPDEFFYIAVSSILIFILMCIDLWYRQSMRISTPDEKGNRY